MADHHKEGEKIGKGLGGCQKVLLWGGSWGKVSKIKQKIIIQHSQIYHSSGKGRNC